MTEIRRAADGIVYAQDVVSRPLTTEEPPEAEMPKVFFSGETLNHTPVPLDALMTLTASRLCPTCEDAANRTLVTDMNGVPLPLNWTICRVCQRHYRDEVIAAWRETDAATVTTRPIGYDAPLIAYLPSTFGVLPCGHAAANTYEQGKHCPDCGNSGRIKHEIRLDDLIAALTA